MDPVLVLRDTRLQVRPGDTVRTTATVRNAGDLVEQYAFDLLGPAAAWAEVIPATVSVVRRGESTVQILFRPPAGPATPAGAVPFALRCVSRENPDSRAIAEGDLAVGAIHEIVASLTPDVSRGRWHGRWTARFDNRGTAPARLRLSATDERRTLGFALAPAELTVDPGQTGYAYLKARATRPTMLGALTRQRVRLTYTRQTEPDEAVSEGFVDVAFEHVPVLSRTLATLGVLALAGGVAAAVLLSRTGPRDETSARGAPPPKPAVFTARTGEAGAVRLAWAPVAGVTGYRIDKLAGENDVVEGSKPAERQFGALAWTNLQGGLQACFRLVGLNSVGESQPSDRACASAGTAPAPTPTPTPGITPNPSPTGTPTPEVTPTAATPSPTAIPGTEREPRAAYVVYQFFKKDDRAQLDSGLPLQLKTDIQQSLGVDVVVADTDASTRLSADYAGGFVVLYTDGFLTAADAQQFCARNRDSLTTIHAGCSPPSRPGQ